MTVLAPLMKIQLFGHERIIANRFQQVYPEGGKYEKDIFVIIMDRLVWTS
jgi:hypothetical protein